MNSKIILVLAALAFGSPLCAEGADKAHSEPEKAAPAKEATPAAKPADVLEIKPPGKVAKCKPHNAAKADCFICDKTLREKGRLWCKEHARYEDRCFLCHPEIKDAKRLFCNEHSLYEDECFLCHPELKKAKQAGAAPKKG
ncbi:MAG: hypothetical protein M3Y08_17155 [Fibrobacterota bacterium]|nr:hypothetical protein [Fibrobacterota bacterium]